MKQGTKRIIIGAVIAAVVILTAGIGWIAFQAQREQNTDAGMSYQLDEDAAEWDASGVAQDSGSGIKVPGYGTIYFTAGSKEQSVTLYNPEENDCYFVFSLSIDDGDTLYQSGYVEPGKAISEIALAEAPEAGEHTLHIGIATYDSETEQALNNAVVKCDLIVQ